MLPPQRLLSNYKKLNKEDPVREKRLLRPLVIIDH